MIFDFAAIYNAAYLVFPVWQNWNLTGSAHVLAAKFHNRGDINACSVVQLHKVFALYFWQLTLVKSAYHL